MTTRPGEATTARVQLHGVRWATYEALVTEVENRAMRFTYDRGELEIASTSSRLHQTIKSHIARLIHTLTLELGIPIKSGGSTTLKSVLLERGLEPDECFWVENEARVREIGELDLANDPAPDLAIEAEVTRSALDRMSIYASLGAREVWRFTRDSRLLCHVLGADNHYAEVLKSGGFPFLAPSELLPFLLNASAVDETTWIRGFRKWVRDELGGRAGKTSSPSS